jgi:1,4-alpha-glucan branching enzyme
LDALHLGDLDLCLFGAGRHRRLWERLGARVVEGGVVFTVWAPNARRGSVVGDFCAWDGRCHPMTFLGDSGVLECFVAGVEAGALYKFELETAVGDLVLRADPMARAAEHPPGTASRVAADRYDWRDDAWIEARPAKRPAEEPMAVYEVHLGSWRDGLSDGKTYRELAPRLVAHMQRYGFTHLELLPVNSRGDEPLPYRYRGRISST